MAEVATSINQKAWTRNCIFSDIIDILYAFTYRDVVQTHNFHDVTAFHTKKIFVCLKTSWNKLILIKIRNDNYVSISVGHSIFVNRKMVFLYQIIIIYLFFYCENFMCFFTILCVLFIIYHYYLLKFIQYFSNHPVYAYTLVATVKKIVKLISILDHLFKNEIHILDKKEESRYQILSKDIFLHHYWFFRRYEDYLFNPTMYDIWWVEKAWTKVIIF